MTLQNTGSIHGSEIVKACILFGEKLCSGSNPKVCFWTQEMQNKCDKVGIPGFFSKQSDETAVPHLKLLKTGVQKFCSYQDI